MLQCKSGRELKLKNIEWKRQVNWINSGVHTAKMAKQHYSTEHFVALVSFVDSFFRISLSIYFTLYRNIPAGKWHAMRCVRWYHTMMANKMDKKHTEQRRSIFLNFFPSSFSHQQWGKKRFDGIISLLRCNSHSIKWHPRVNASQSVLFT